jgi:hypothetical protein
LNLKDRLKHTREVEVRGVMLMIEIDRLHKVIDEIIQDCEKLRIGAEGTDLALARARITDLDSHNRLLSD